MIKLSTGFAKGPCYPNGGMPCGRTYFKGGLITILHDEIVQKIMTTLELQITVQEQGLVVHKRTTNLEAYDAYLLKSDGYKAKDQRKVPSMAVASNLCDKIREAKNDAQPAQPAYNREVTTPTDSTGGPSVCVCPVYHNVSPMH
jgi:hypothetical protein